MARKGEKRDSALTAMLASRKIARLFKSTLIHQNVQLDYEYLATLVRRIIAERDKIVWNRAARMTQYEISKEIMQRPVTGFLSDKMAAIPSIRKKMVTAGVSSAQKLSQIAGPEPELEELTPEQKGRYCPHDTNGDGNCAYHPNGCPKPQQIKLKKR